MGKRIFAQTRDHRVFAVYVPPKKWLDRAFVDEVASEFAEHIDNGGRVRIYYHRGAIDPDLIADRRIEIRRIPFALTMAAGAV